MHKHLAWGAGLGVVLLWGVAAGCDSEETTDPMPTLTGGNAASGGTAGSAAQGGQGGGGAPCGNGVTEDPEECDDGTANSDTTPDACRTDCTLPTCGDGVLDPGYDEACDDGNTSSGDECSGDCRVYRSITGLGITATTYDLARDNDDRVHIIWQQNDGLHYGRIENGEVPQATREAIPDSDDVHIRFARPRLAASPDGSLLATCWISPNPNRGEHVYCTRRDSSGWLSARETVWSRTGDYRAAQPALAVDAVGAIHLIAQLYEDNGAVNPDRYVAYWLRPATGPWPANATRLFDDGEEWRGLAMCADRDGGVHATWKRTPWPGRYAYAQSGDSLITATPIEVGDVWVSIGESAVSDGGDVHHVYVDFPNWRLRYTSKSGAGGFSPSMPIATWSDTDWDLWPDIGLDQHDRIYVVWGEMRGSTVSHVMLAMNGAGSWTSETLATDAEIDPESHVALAVTRTAAHVVWRGTGGELQLGVLAHAP